MPKVVAVVSSINDSGNSEPDLSAFSFAQYRKVSVLATDETPTVPPTEYLVEVDYE